MHQKTGLPQKIFALAYNGRRLTEAGFTPQINGRLSEWICFRAELCTQSNFRGKL